MSILAETTNNQKDNTKSNNPLSDFYDVGMTEAFKTVIEDHLIYF